MNNETGKYQADEKNYTPYAIGWIVNPVDPSAVWNAAFASLWRFAGISISEIVDTIGPYECPNIKDCLIVLMPKPEFIGCEAIDILCADARYLRI